MQQDQIRAQKDVSTVNSSGKRHDKLIDGVVVRHAVTHEDERGEVTEIISSAWSFGDTPVDHVYQAMIRPGRVKGWVYHKLQSDRQFILAGFIKYVLWDARTDSPTAGAVNEVYMSERNRGLILIPPYVVHAVQNIGRTDAVFINLPTLPYNHADPDKYRVDPASVPYSFDKGLGW